MPTGIKTLKTKNDVSKPYISIILPNKGGINADTP
jgi:hypothetical protein